MKVHQKYTDSQLRNFTYIIELNNGSAIAIDPWNDDIVNQVLIERKLSLKAIINTHEHWDHIQGNEALKEQHNCEIWAHHKGKGKIPGITRTLMEFEKIQLESEAVIEVLDTPGHSQAHLCFVVSIKNKPTYIFTGDILFNAGVGHCHSGDVNDLYNTIKDKFSELNDELIIYPGHDYIENNLHFTLNREPNNPDARLWLEKYKNFDIHKNPMVTTMGDERRFNTFLRLTNSEIINNLPLQNPTQKEVFVTLRKFRDNW